MTYRPPHEDEGRFALWGRNRPVTAVDSQSVLLAHADVSVGESIALLLRLKRVVAVATVELQLALKEEVHITTTDPREKVVRPSFGLRSDARAAQGHCPHWRRRSRRNVF
jgi:hypothetical protein